MREGIRLFKSPRYFQTFFKGNFSIFLLADIAVPTPAHDADHLRPNPAPLVPVPPPAGMHASIHTRPARTQPFCRPPLRRGQPSAPALRPRSTRTDTSSLPSLARALPTRARQPLRTHTTRARQDPLSLRTPEPSITQPNPAVVCVPRLSPPRPRQNPSSQPTACPPMRASHILCPPPPRVPLSSSTLTLSPSTRAHSRLRTIPHDPTQSHTFPHDPTRSHTSSS